MSRPSTFWRRLFAGEPINHARWEMVVMRVLMVALIFDLPTKIIDLAAARTEKAQDILRRIPALTDAVRVPDRDHPSNAARTATALGTYLFDLTVLPDVSRFKSQPHPNGLARLVDLSLLNSEWAPARPPGGKPLTVGRALEGGCYAALALYACGIAMPLASAYLFGVLLVFGTFHNSQGSIHHHLQLITLILGLQSIAGWRSVIRSASRGREFVRLSTRGLATVTDWTRQAVVAAYVVSALSKLWMSGGFWMWKVPRLGVQLRKAADQDYYDSLTHTTAAHAWLPEWCVEHPWLARLIFAPALPLELFFVFALRNRRLAALYALAMVGFHLCVSGLMSLDFRFNVQLLLIYFVNIPFWIHIVDRWVRMKPLMTAADESVALRAGRA